MHAHKCIPLYAYAVGHPLRVLSPRGAWEMGVVVDRAPLTNQFVVRMPPAANLHWTVLLPWNHASMPLHARVPLFAVRPYDWLRWNPSEIGGSASTRTRKLLAMGEDGAEMSERDGAHRLDENVTCEVEYARTVDFVLNIRAAARAFRSWRALWCPGVVVGIHRKPTRSSSLSGALVSKTCDVVAGTYNFDADWTAAEQPLLIRQLVAPAAAYIVAAAAAASSYGARPHIRL